MDGNEERYHGAGAVTDNGEPDDSHIREGITRRKKEMAIEKRRIFERHLEEEGLVLEREFLEGSALNFVKIHSPIKVLKRYAEILRLRMPMKEVEEDTSKMDSFHTESPGRRSRWSGASNWFQKHIDYDRCQFPPLNQRLTAIYSRDKEYLFDLDDKEFFSQSTRSTIVDFIIRRQRFSDDPFEDFAFGIERLINDKVYCAAYPLHDGDLKSPGERRLLYKEWASLRNFYKCQPLDHIKEYFGVNVGLYFAWLGFYTRMLIPASILGLFCFIYGVGTLSSDEYSKKVCANNSDNETRVMCPICSGCNYWTLNSTCIFSKLTYVSDNNATIVFAVLMSFWAAIFLEFWKRYSAQITHKWDLSTFDITEEQPRLEYLSRLKRLKKLDTDVVNTNTEPHVSFWKTRVPFQLISLSAVLFLVTLAGAVLVGVIAYRVLMVRTLEPGSGMLVTASAAFINLVIICIFNLIYRGVAQFFTEMELHRTQTEFDDALTLKIFVLQFVNYYSSIFYIAFCKGRFVDSPDHRGNLLSDERCGAAGCMSDLCIQLAIIMVGKQFMGGVLEMTTPVIQKWVTSFKLMVTSKRRKTRRPAFSTQWAKDYKLAAWHSRSLFSEYLEMVLQYGFVTIFVAAFPLAPVFALLNNILEMRLDATKMLIYNRRPVGQKSKSIGIWYGILDTISRIAVISNAFIIAFTSNFVPRAMNYFMTPDEDIPFFERSFVSFNISHFHKETRLPQPKLNDTLYEKVNSSGICWYQGFDFNHTFPERERYKNSDFYWKVVAARLIFVVVFQNFVSVCVLLLKVLIPDVPKKLKKRILHENHLTSEIIIKQEMLRARQDSEPRFLDHEISLSPPPTGEGSHTGHASGAEPETPTTNPNAQPPQTEENGKVFRTIKIWSRCGGGNRRNSSSDDEQNDTPV